MTITSLLNKARKEWEIAKVHAEHDGKTAQAARQTAVAAKKRLKQARKLAKFTRKVARKAEDQAETALEKLEQARARVEKLEKRARKIASRQKKLPAEKAAVTVAPKKDARQASQPKVAAAKPKGAPSKRLTAKVVKAVVKKKGPGARRPSSPSVAGPVAGEAGLPTTEAPAASDMTEVPGDAAGL